VACGLINRVAIGYTDTDKKEFLEFEAAQLFIISYWLTAIQFGADDVK
jgi:hypothetical protein